MRQYIKQLKLVTQESDKTDAKLKEKEKEVEELKLVIAEKDEQMKAYS